MTVLEQERPTPAPLLRNGYALMANTAVTAALGMAYWLVAARLYPPAAVGAGGAAVSALLFVAGVSQMNFMGAVVRFLPVAGAASKRLLASTYAVSCAAAGVLGTVAVATSPWWAPDDSPLRSGAPAAAVFVIGVAAWCVFVLQDSALTAVRQAVWVPVENGLYGLAKLAMLVGFAVAVAGPATGTGILASWALPAAACIVPVNLLLFRRFIPSHIAARRDHEPFPLSIRRVARFVGGDYVGSLFNQALISLMPLLVVVLVGSEGGGHFYVAWTIATTMDLLASNLATSMTVEGALDEGRVAQFGREILRRVATVLVPVVAAAAALAGVVLGLFGAGYRSNSATLLRLLVLATIPRALATVYVGLCRVERRVSHIAGVQAAQAVLVLGLAAALVPWLGIVGAGVATLVGQTAVAVGVLPRLRRRLASAAGIAEID
ncbi:MAG: lipopolysaccharide biosynthesis protein [Acidimicrobiales bacterium]